MSSDPVAILDGIIAGMQQLREALVAAETPVETATTHEEHDLLEASIVAARLGLRPDSVRKNARENGIGKKVGRKWLVSLTAAKAIRRSRSR